MGIDVSLPAGLRRARLPGWLVLVAVMVAHPRHGPGQRRLVATLGREVEVVVGADQQVEPARISRVGVEDGAVIVLVEGAEAGKLAKPSTRS